MVDSPDLSTETPDAELPFGVPAPYWLDLRDYDPVAVAAGLPQPMLLVQGGRDYQATVADDLSRWRAASASGRMSRSACTRPTTTSSSPGPARPARPNSRPRSTSTPRSSPTWPTG